MLQVHLLKFHWRFDKKTFEGWGRSFKQTELAAGQALGEQLIVTWAAPCKLGAKQVKGKARTSKVHGIPRGPFLGVPELIMKEYMTNIQLTFIRALVS